MASALPRLLTARQVCEQFGTFKLHRLYQLARRGDIPAVRLGRAYRFSMTALEAWLAAGGTRCAADASAAKAATPHRAAGPQ